VSLVDGRLGARVSRFGSTLAVAFAAAACSSSEGSKPAPTPIDTESELEIFSWWTASGEAEGLLALFDRFERDHDDVRIVNAAVEGGAGVNAKEKLATRMADGDPPDAFQVHAGRELIDTWVESGGVEPVTFLFEEHDWLDRYPPGLIEILSQGGEIWSVPVNIHRSNVLFANGAALQTIDAEPPATWDEFLTIAEELSAEGITPLALGTEEPWTAAHLFESLLLANLNTDGYERLWTDETAWSGPEVTAALELLADLLEHVGEDHAELTWDEAARQVSDGSAAMTVMGDWAEGYFKSAGRVLGVEIVWAPSPGTAGSFLMLSDSFALPEGAPERENALDWLRVCGSAEGQDAFNPLKGSIPARLDADRSLYDAYLTSAMDDFSRDEIAPSFVHGAAAGPEWSSAIVDAIAEFVMSQDVEATQSLLVQAAAGRARD
jgi:glucose/mannose transport system substrate-binding protein